MNRFQPTPSSRSRRLAEVALLFLRLGIAAFGGAAIGFVARFLFAGG